MTFVKNSLCYGFFSREGEVVFEEKHGVNGWMDEWMDGWMNGWMDG